MKKRGLIFFVLLVLSIIMVFPVQAAASSSRLVDKAKVLSDHEVEELKRMLDEISNRQSFDVVVLTVPDLYGEDISTFADDFYDENGYREDGILLMISDYDHEWAISTVGSGIGAFTDAGQEYIVGQFIDDMSEGLYYEAFYTYAQLCDAFVTQANTGKPYDVGTLPRGPFRAVKSMLISVGIGLFSSLIATGTMKDKLKTVQSQAAAADYVKMGSLTVKERREMFLYRQLHRTKRENKQNGGSSTHMSSSGRAHGGSKGSY